MNLEDVIDPEYGLQQDDYSISGAVFGEEGQLSVVGWSGKHRDRGNKFYILKCSKCSQDMELFGEGCFKSRKSSLEAGGLPCGCSQKPQWTREQFAILCSRKAKEIGYTFLRFEGEWRGQMTKIKMSCEKHGEWSSGTIQHLTKHGHGCPGCKRETISEANKKSDEEMIASFFASGAFHPDTKFWRSDRTTKQGWKISWYMSCPECCEQGVSLCTNLKLGNRNCACSRHRQKEAYINLVKDNYNTFAIKFGITRDSSIRVQQQDSKSIYTLKQHSVYSFSSVEACKAAERECKQTLECGVVLKRDMPDGWTETTWVYNLDKIKAIYEKHGGVIKEGQDKAKLLF